MVFASTPANVLAGLHQRGVGAPWALITGATTGIGRDITHDIARRGFNIIIHGRRAHALDALSQSLATEHGCEVKTFCLDATAAFDSVNPAWKLLDDFGGLDLRVLVNNVGTGHDPAGFAPFSESTPVEMKALIDINIGFMTRLTHALLPALRRTASPASPSFIINAGSLADQGLPYIAVYSGTKAYIRAFSNALDTELLAERANVRVVASIIGDTDSDGHKVGVGLFTPDSKSMARIMLDSAAKSLGGATTPYWGHWIQEWLVKIQPYYLLRLGLIAHFRTLLAAREKGGESGIAYVGPNLVNESLNNVV